MNTGYSFLFNKLGQDNVHRRYCLSFIGNGPDDIHKNKKVLKYFLCTCTIIILLNIIICGQHANCAGRMDFACGAIFVLYEIQVLAL